MLKGLLQIFYNHDLDRRDKPEIRELINMQLTMLRDLHKVSLDSKGLLKRSINDTELT